MSLLETYVQLWAENLGSRAKIFLPTTLDPHLL